MIKLIDDQVGRMLAALEASGQREEHGGDLYFGSRGDAGGSRINTKGLSLL